MAGKDATVDLSPDERLGQLGKLLTTKKVGLSVDSLLDSFLALYDECTYSELRREKIIADFVKEFEPIVADIRRHVMRRADFDTLKIIGRGAFGEVHLVRQKHTKQVYAMKILNKWEMLKRQEAACFKEERSVLLQAQGDYLTALHYCFQDQSFLYLVMEYYPGGDLLTLITKFDDVMAEDMARFYTAEVVMAVDSIHKMGFVHRDVKPDNVLIDRTGHIRLADFGSCAYVGDTGAITSPVTVGTPDYISPEALRAVEGKGSYGKASDWWSCGVMLYEMLVGETPFYNESLMATYAAISNFKELEFPEDNELSDNVQDLVRRLLTGQNERLGSKNADDIKNHKWFKGIQWSSLRSTTPPYVPEVASIDDASNFNSDDIEDRPEVLNTAEPKRRQAFSGHHLPFIGFSYSPALAHAVDVAVSLKDGAGGKALVATLSQSNLNDGISELKPPKQQTARRESGILNVPHALDRTSSQSDLGLQIQEKDRRVAELEMAQTKLQKDLSELQAALDEEKRSHTQVASEKASFEQQLTSLRDKVVVAETSAAEAESKLRRKEAELRATSLKVDAEVEEKAVAVKARREALAKIESMRSELEAAIEAKQKADRKVAELSMEIREHQQSSTNKRDASEVEEKLQAKDKVIASLKKQIEDERDQNDKKVQDLQEKMAAATKDSQSQIKQLEVEVERLTVARANLETAQAMSNRELEDISHQLSTAIDDLFEAQKLKVTVETDLRLVEEKLKAQQAISEADKKQIELLSKGKEEAEHALVLAEQSAAMWEARAGKAETELKEVKAELRTAREQLANESSDDKQEDLREIQAKLDSELEIRKMMEETNEEMTKELQGLRDQLDAAVVQRQKIQTERNELSTALEPVKAELERELAKNKDARVKIERLEKEVSSLERKLSEAAALSESTIESLKQRRVTDVADAQNALKQAEKARKDAETAAAETKSRISKLENELAEVKRELTSANRKSEDLAAKLRAAESKPVAESESRSEASADDILFLESKIRDLERALQETEEEVETADAAADQLEVQLREKTALVTNLQSQLEQQIQQNGVEIRRTKVLQSDLEVLKGDLERETVRRKQLEKDKQALVVDVDELRESLQKTTAERDDAIDDLRKKELKLREANESLDILRESAAREMSAMTLDRKRSMKDFSMKVKEANTTTSSLRRRQTINESKAKAAAAVAAVDASISVTADRKRIIELEANVHTLKAQIQEHVTETEELQERLKKKEQELTLSAKTKQQLELLVSELDGKYSRELKARESVAQELETVKKELSTVNTRLSEQQKLRLDLESKLRRKEGEAAQLTMQLNEAVAAQKELTSQTQQLREEAETQEKRAIKLSIVRDRLARDVDDLKTQLMSSDDGRIQNLMAQLKRKEEELENASSTQNGKFDELLNKANEERRDLKTELDNIKTALKKSEEARDKAASDLAQLQSTHDSLNRKLAEIQRDENSASSSINKEKQERQALEAKLRDLNTSLSDTLNKLQFAQELNLQFQTQLAELQSQRLLSRTVSSMSIPAATADELEELKQQLAQAERENDRLSKILKDADLDKNELMRRPSRLKMNQNWQQSREEKIKLQDMRSLRQDLEVTIQAKIQIEKAFQELKVEREQLVQSVEALKEKLSEAEAERDTEKERTKALELNLKNRGADVRVVVEQSRSVSNASKLAIKRPGLRISTSASHTEGLDEVPESPAVEVQQLTSDGQLHRFNLANFTLPTRCDHCMKMILGLVRQGYSCDACGYVCHDECRSQTSPKCGFHAHSIDMEDLPDGPLKTPKPRGIKAGWRKVIAYISGEQLYLFNAENEKGSQSVDFVADLRSPFFNVSDVHPNDVIHAARKDVPNIFRIQFGGPNEPQRFLLATSVSDKARWIKALDRLHRKAESLPIPKIYAPMQKHADKPLNKITVNIMSIRQRDEQAIIGTEAGLFINSDIGGGFVKVSPAKSVLQIDVLEKEKLVVVLAGKSQSVRFFPIDVLDNKPSWCIELDITKGCQRYAIGVVNGDTHVAALVKKRLFLFKVDRRKLFPKVKEIAIPDAGSSVQFFGENICVGFGNKFRVLDLSDMQQSVDLPSRSDKTFAWLFNQALIAVAMFKIGQDYLLCFNAIGVFVDQTGKRARPLELHWTAYPLSFTIRNRYLFVFTAEFVDVMSLEDGQVKQTIPVANVTAVDADSRFISTLDTLFQLEFVGNGVETLDGEDESMFKRVKELAQRQGSNSQLPITAAQAETWTADDAEKLKKEISQGKLADDDDEEEEDDDDDDSTVAPIVNKPKTTTTATSTTSKTTSTSASASSNKGTTQEDSTKNLEFLYNW